jgi:hypothetical protein
MVVPPLGGGGAQSQLRRPRRESIWPPDGHERSCIVLRIMRFFLASLSALTVAGVAASSASAIEAPYYKVAKARLGAGETKEVLVEGQGNQVLTNATSKITITCTGLKAKLGATINGSAAGEPGTSAGSLEYTNCTTEGNGEKCQLEGKAFTTDPLKDELAYAVKQEPLLKGNKIVDLFTPASGAVFANLRFKAEAGGKCTFAETAVEGSVLAEIQNSKKETIAVEEHEAEEEFAFMKTITGEACKVKASKFTECKKSAVKAFGTASTIVTVVKIALVIKALWGFFHK